MPQLALPDAREPFVVNGLVNPVWYRFLATITGLLREDPALGDYSASMIETTGGSTVQAQLDSMTAAIDLLAPQSRSISAGTGLSGGGTLEADRTFAVDIASLEELTTVDKAKDFVMILDATDSKLYKMTPTNLGVP